jgi:membrane-associated phospholipid phosphatase
LAILLSLASFPEARAQHDSLNGGTRIDKQYIFSYWHDTKAIVKEPFHWKARQWSAFAGIVGVGIIAYAYDQEIYDFFAQNNSNASENISKYVIEPWGSGLYSIPLLAGIYLTSSGESRHRRIALTGVKAYLLSGGAAVVSKHLFHRHRPDDDDPPDPRKWEGPFPFTTNYTSFPSGHTTTAFAIATVLAMGYPDKLWVGMTSYTLASLVAVSRIHDGKHWGSDVVAGAALGFFIGATLSKVNLKKVKVSPAAFRGGQGVKLTWALN